MNSKNTLLWVVIAVAVILVVWTFNSGVLNKGGEGGGGEGKLEESPQTVNEGSGPEANAPVYSGQQGSTFTQSQIQNYSALVNEYGDRRVQFDEGCQMSPADVSFKNGTSVMLDNRSPSPRTIKIGSQSYYFQPYGYKILTLSSAVLPASLKISCDAAPEVGNILLQANILGE